MILGESKRVRGRDILSERLEIIPGKAREDQVEKLYKWLDSVTIKGPIGTKTVEVYVSRDGRVPLLSTVSTQEGLVLVKTNDRGVRL